MNNTDEKREFIRYSLKATGSVSFEGKIFQGTVSDISIGGIFLLLDSPLADDDVNKECEAVLIVDIEDEEKKVEFVSRVVRVNSEGVGLYFVDMDQQSKDFLHDIIVELRSLKK
jgi:hypothetical protein